MTQPTWQSGRPAAPLHVDEDGGLAALMGTQNVTLARESVLKEPAILQAVRDVLQTAFADAGRTQYLDPFAPASERNAEVVSVLRAAIAEHRQRGGVLGRVPADDETLLALFAATLGWGPAQRYLDQNRRPSHPRPGGRQALRDSARGVHFDG
jgi:pilus assembly protein CpaF